MPATVMEICILISMSWQLFGYNYCRWDESVGCVRAVSCYSACRKNIKAVQTIIAGGTAWDVAVPCHSSKSHKNKAESCPGL